MNIFLSILVFLLIVLLAVIGGVFFYIYWWAIQRATPDLDGDLILPCLEQPVEIRRDKHGIPHIYAQNRGDLFRAQGFVHAQERLWQMEQNRRIARGTLAEIFGEVALEADRFSRIVGFWRAAQAELAAIDAETHQVLTWYAEGVNAFIQARPGRLSAEFSLLRFQPEPWTPLDSLGYAKVIGWALGVNWESELTRLRLFNTVGPLAASQLEADYPSINPVILEGVGSQTMTRLLSTAGLLLNQYETLRSWLNTHPAGQGSNSWVLAPKVSLSRRPLLCSDPHMSVSIPTVWFENHLICPDFAVSGASFTGEPGVVIGHNEHIAWGMTNAMVDVQDLYLERAHPDDPTQFEYNGVWEKAEIIDEQINVRRSQPHIERVLITRHGPLISRFIANSEQRMADQALDAAQPVAGDLHLALRWIGHEPGHIVRAILKLNQATDWNEFCAALADWSVPAQNVTYADTKGNIGYLLAATAPRRDKNPGLVPAPGWTDAYEWCGTIPVAELPRLFNPESGKIVTANNKMVGDDYPYFLGVEFDPGWRANRIEEQLSLKERYTVRDMEEMQLDTFSKYAQMLTPWLTLINSEDPWEKVALATLRKWNFRADVDSEAPTIFHYTVIQLLKMIFGDKLGAAGSAYLGVTVNPLFLIHGFISRAEANLLDLLNNHEQSVWYTDAATGKARTREELLQEAFSHAVKKLREHTGDSKRLWSWGRLHQVRYVHPLGSARFLRNIFNRGPFPVGGDGASPFIARSALQVPIGLVQVTACYRQIFEVGAWDRAQSVINIGQSGHPLSPHYDNQIVMWREGAYHPMPWSEESVRTATAHRMMLRPPKR